jgi:CubicO group peptidase (beta-lactamase class C family)
MLLLLLACDPSPPDTSTEPVDTADTGDTADTDDMSLSPLYDVDAIAAIEQAVKRDLRGSNASGVQIAVWVDGRVVYTLESGSAHPDEDQPIDSTTLFQIGSDTKKMTALVALQQVEDGTLSLDSTVEEVLPAVVLNLSPDWSSQATLHDLLSHQGGLFDYTPWSHDPDDAQLAGIAEGIFADSEWAMNEPGNFWNYSNPNFSLAGLMSERVAGVAWPDLMREQLFEPMGLTDTYARRSEVEARGNYATGWGYTIDDPDEWNLFDTPAYTEGTVEMAQVADNAFTRPAGLVWSTASDMARFHGFFIDGDPAILDDTLRTEMTTMHTRLYPAWEAQGYGYGWMVIDGISLPEPYDIPVWVHGGNTLSFTSTSYVLPEQGMSISVLSNGYGDDFTSTVVALITGSGLLPASAEISSFPTEETDHASLVGTYTDHVLGRIEVSDEDGTLTAAMPDADAAGIQHGSTLEYAGVTDVYSLSLGRSASTFVFTPDDAGEYQWLANRAFVGTRGEVNARVRAERASSPLDLLQLGPDFRDHPLLRPAR